MYALDSVRSDYLRATRSLRFAAFATRLLASYEAAILSAPAERHQAIRAAHKAMMGRGTLEVLGARVSVEGRVPREPRPRLVIANHRSGLDIAVMLSLFDATMLSRADVAGWPVLGRLARQGGTLFVDREDKNSGARAIRAMRRALATGAAVCVFPEGTTRGGEEVGPFQPGAFVAARGLEVDVVPVGFAYEPGTEWIEPTFLAHLSSVASRPGAKMHVCVGEPFALTGKSDQAAERARAAVSELAARARLRLGRASEAPT